MERRHAAAADDGEHRDPADVFRQHVAAIPKGSYRRVAELAGLSNSIVTRWKKPGATINPTLATIKAVAEVLNKPLWQMLYDEPPRTGAVDIEKAGERLAMLPAAVGQVGAGPARMDVSSRARRYAFRQEWLEGRHLDARRMVVVRVARGHGGESMMPLIRPGSLLVVDRGPSVEGWPALEPAHEGKVFVVRHPDEEGAKVKRVYRASATQLVFWSDNEMTTPRVEVVTPGETRLQTILLGRVVWVGRDEE